MKNFVVFAALVLLVSAAFAQTQPPTDTTTPPTETNTLIELITETPEHIKNAADATIGWLWQEGSCEDPWAQQSDAFALSQLEPSLIVVLTAVFFATLIYLIGVALQSSNLIAMAKDELWQSGWTVIRIAFIFGMMASANVWFSSAYYNASYIDLAMTFSKDMVYKISENIGFLLIYNTILHALYSATLQWGMFSWRAMFSFNLGPVLKPLVDIIGMTLQLLFVAVGEWIIHIVTLCAIKKWTWSLFIPFALLLRSFPPTRGGGDALLALFLSLAFFYPLMFIVDAEVYRMTRHNLVDGQSVISQFFSIGLFGSLGLLVAMMMLLSSAFAPFLLNSALPIAFSLIKNAIYFIVIMGFVLPFFNIFITLTAAREMAKVFGVDVNFMGFVRII
jgi:hypothetical protein